MRGRGLLPRWFVVTMQQRAVLLAVVAALFAMGIIAGGVMAGTLDTEGSKELATYLRESLSSLAREGPASTGWQWIVVEDVLKPAGLVWLLGMSVIGVPLISAVVFLRGFVIGFTLAFLLKVMVFRGFLLAIVALIPQNLLLIPGLVLASVGAIAFSLGALQIVLGRTGAGDIYHHLQVEGGVVLAGCTLLLAGGFLKAYVTPVITAFASRFLL